MKKKTYKLFAAMLFFAATLFLLSCPAFFSENKQHLLSGNFGPFKFIANPAAGRSARSNMPFDAQELIGTMFDGTGHYEVTGYYDDKTGNFILTAFSGDSVFMIEGILLHDNWEGTGNFIGEDSAGYTLEQWEITFDNTVDLEGNPIVFEDKLTLPEHWWGKWSIPQEGDNRFASERWNVSYGKAGRYCMIISKYGIAIWSDIPLLIQDYKKASRPDLAPQDLDDSIRVEINIERERMMTYSILEIDVISPNEYHVLIAIPLHSDQELIYQKHRYRYNEEENYLTATLGVNIEENEFNFFDIEMAKESVFDDENFEATLILRRF